MDFLSAHGRGFYRIGSATMARTGRALFLDPPAVAKARFEWCFEKMDSSFTEMVWRTFADRGHSEFRRASVLCPVPAGQYPADSESGRKWAFMSLAIVWIDHEQAKIFHFSRTKMERKVMTAESAVSSASHFNGICTEISSAERLLILGPCAAKYELCSHLRAHHPALAKILAGCESLDQPTDALIADYAQKFLKLARI